MLMLLFWLLGFFLFSFFLFFGVVDADMDAAGPTSLYPLHRSKTIHLVCGKH